MDIDKNELYIIRQIAHDISLKCGDITSTINVMLYNPAHYLSADELESKFDNECNELTSLFKRFLDRVREVM